MTHKDTDKYLSATQTHTFPSAKGTGEAWTSSLLLQQKHTSFPAGLIPKEDFWKDGPHVCHEWPPPKLLLVPTEPGRDEAHRDGRSAPERYPLVRDKTSLWLLNVDARP